MRLGGVYASLFFKDSSQSREVPRQGPVSPSFVKGVMATGGFKMGPGNRCQSPSL